MPSTEVCANDICTHTLVLGTTRPDELYCMLQDFTRSYSKLLLLTIGTNLVLRNFPAASGTNLVTLIVGRRSWGFRKIRTISHDICTLSLRHLYAKSTRSGRKSDVNRTLSSVRSYDIGYGMSRCVVLYRYRVRYPT